MALTLRQIEREARAAGMAVEMYWTWNDRVSYMVLTARVFVYEVLTREYILSVPRAMWDRKLQDFVTRPNRKAVQQSMYREMPGILLMAPEECGHAKRR